MKILKNAGQIITNNYIVIISDCKLLFFFSIFDGKAWSILVDSLKGLALQHLSFATWKPYGFSGGAAWFWMPLLTDFVPPWPGNWCRMCLLWAWGFGAFGSSKRLQKMQIATASLQMSRTNPKGTARWDRQDGDTSVVANRDMQSWPPCDSLMAFYALVGEVPLETLIPCHCHWWYDMWWFVGTYC